MRLAASLSVLSTKRSVYFAVALIFTLIALCCVGSSLVIEIESFVFPFLVGDYVIVTFDPVHPPTLVFAPVVNAAGVTLHSLLRKAVEPCPYFPRSDAAAAHRLPRSDQGKGVSCI